MKYTIDIEVHVADNTAPASLNDDLTSAVTRAVQSVSGVVGVNVTQIATEERPKE